MSENQRTERERTKPTPKARGSEEKLWHYAVSAFALLVILTMAILAPNYWNYRYRVKQLERFSISTNAVLTSAPAGVVASNAPPAAAVTPPKSGIEVVGEAPLKTSDIYETYGQLITMLLGFVAAVGVLCGYFAKKSVRELTEDVRADMDREKEWFRRECDLALKQTENAKQEATESLAAAKKLEQELQDLVRENKQQLAALDEAIARYKEKGAPQAPSTTKTTATVDEQLAKEGV